MLEYLQRLFRYDAWANEEALRAIARADERDRSRAPLGQHGSETRAHTMDGEGGRAKRLMAHIVAAEWLWLKRLGQGKAIAVWPELTIEECAREQEELRSAWEEYLSAMSEAGLAEAIAYTNTKGERFTNTRQDVLMHVVMHSAYHRGQIAAALRQQGEEPAYTDFIEAVRRGFV